MAKKKDKPAVETTGEELAAAELELAAAPNLDEPQYRLPPDVFIRASTVPFAELIDWPAKFLNLPEIWLKHSGKGIKVAILDTGCDTEHPDLQGKILAAKDFSGSPYGPIDKSSHGTWCAGAIAANADANGIRGVAFESQLIIAKVLGDQGSGSDSGILRGMTWCFDQGADIFSLSLGGGQMSENLHREFLRIAAAGKFIICAAGNDAGPINYPAAWADSCLSVGACDEQGRLTRFTSRGPSLGIVAPGQNMISTIPGRKYGSMSGTSMSTPIVAGITALALAKHRIAGGRTPLENITQLRELYKHTSTPLPEGYGLVNPEKLLADIGGPVVVTPPPVGSLPLIPGFNAPFALPAANPVVLVYVKQG